MKEFDFIEKIRREEERRFLKGPRGFSRQGKFESRQRKIESHSVGTMRKTPVVRGIGDDCAVLDRGKYYELIGTDMLVEDDHFRLDWSSPKQIGHKAMMSNLSDIAAMGGKARYAFVSLCLTRAIDEKWLESFYKGLRCVPDVLILGGDITHGEKVVVSLTIVGEVQKEFCCFRSGAKVGEVICVTGSLGASSAGLEFLKSSMTDVEFPRINERYCILKHLEASARLKEAPIIARYASAMIDVSDGLGSEVSHICKESAMGARVWAEKVPIDRRVRKLADFLKKDPLVFAMSGGEDFELCFTMSAAKVLALKKELLQFNCELTVVGEIVSKAKGVLFCREGKEFPMPPGYVHF